ncbi:ATP-NAD kinase-like domain-containing protein [Syncephalis pseudoplumigaleata]|uniref:ATP-NAD kinase-like domain-containing protein n=1 Tax=Syncephalis pseudoplumigaleata TaxID=1712513 RepID=A0A4P9Z4P6_9FUNG|nr:ATP-NAD kinase-like domain-containing protein [Syncephalis pseudoplumigaleata]|eukprot:RKP27435.1 ATP-NAD kinase-like domain-containing protein [Syncephalis pseudoplumigaleata]
MIVDSARGDDAPIVVREQAHVNSWWKGGGTRSLTGSLQLTRETLLTHDKKDRRTAAFLTWSHTGSHRGQTASTKKIRHALSIKKKPKGHRTIRVPLERCYAVHRTNHSILPAVYRGSSPSDGGGSMSLPASLALKHIAPIEDIGDAGQFADKLAQTTQALQQEEKPDGAEQADVTLHLVTVFGLRQNGLRSRHRAWTFAFPNDATATAWTLWLRQEIYGQDGMPPRQRLLAILNPFGGTRSATRIYRQIVEPMAQLAGVTMTLVETERSKHATEFVHALDLSLYDGLISISGDGLYHEIVVGGRKDWDVACQFPIGIVPAGSGNAMAVSVDQPTPELAMAAALCAADHMHACSLGDVRPMDIMAITSLASREVYYAHEMVTWSLVADIDIEADRYRWAGPARFTMSAVWRMLSLRQYKARIHYLPNDKQPASGHSEHADAASTALPSNRPPLKYTRFCHEGEIAAATPPALPDGWHSYEGPVAHFIASSLPWISPDTYIAPTAGISSGHIDLVWLAKPDHALQLLPVLADDGRGDYLKSPHTQWHQVRAVILEPLGRVRDPQLQGIMDVDGELVSCESLAIECLPGLARMIVPRWLDEAKVARRT